MICVLLLEYNSIFTNPQLTVLFNEFLQISQIGSPPP